MYIEEIRIPKTRIGVLIGSKGDVKKKIERLFGVKLVIDSKNNMVKIESEDSLSVFNTKPMIMAICRGFNPDIADKLKNDDTIIEFINIKDYSGGSRKKFIRLKSRIIGSKGEARTNIEDMTDTEVTIYGKTIGIIGGIEDVSIAIDAFKDLLQGAPHGNAYRRIIERKKNINQ